MDAGQSIVDDLEPFVWSNDESIAYEVTVEMINEVVGLCSALDEAQHDGEGNPLEAPALEQLAKVRREWCRRRDSLDPTNHDEIRRIQQECREAIDNLRHA